MKIKLLIHNCVKFNLIILSWNLLHYVNCNWFVYCVCVIADVDVFVNYTNVTINLVMLDYITW